MKVRAFAAIATSALAAACGGGTSSRTTHGPLGGDVARVGDATIPASLVVAVVQSRGVSSRRALDALIADALAAQAAAAEGLDRGSSPAWRATLSAARATTQRIMAQARAEGPPVDDELATLTVVHAVVLRTPSVEDERAFANAAMIHDAVTGARTAEEFEARARAAPHPGTQVIVERLPPFAADGRPAPGAPPFDPTFVAIAFTLHQPAEVSPVFETPFGWHTVFLVERAAPAAATVSSVRSSLATTIAEMRGRARTMAILRERKGAARIEIAPLADTLMAEAVTGTL